MPSVAIRAANRFCNHPLWNEAAWIATTFRCHPTGDIPPVMGLVFGDSDKGVKLFTTWNDDWSHSDREDAIRIAAIEGDIPGQPAGYTIRISADEMEAGQVQRMYPTLDAESFQQFKAQYLKHGEYMLCPVVQREGQIWFNAYAGIVKQKIVFRSVDEIAENDQDAIVKRETAIDKVLTELDTILNKNIPR